MRYVVDAPNGKSWFRLETEAEAALESQLMRHAVEKYFRLEHEKAVQTYQPASKSFIEQDIGLKSHIQHVMPLFLTLRDQDGKAHVTAMLPPGGKAMPARASSSSAPAMPIPIRPRATPSRRSAIISA